jgi:arsenate reductase
MDFIITVCDNAAGEVCPAWPGQPLTAHWSIPDPAAVEGSEEAQRRAFSDACHLLLARIRLFTSLPIAKLDRLALGKKLDQQARPLR